MKSYMSVALVAVYLFGLIVSLNSSPISSCLPGTSGKSNAMTEAISKLENNISTCGVSKASPKPVPNVEGTAKILNGKKDDGQIICFSELKLDTEFNLRATDAWKEILDGLIKNGNSADQENNARVLLLVYTKTKLMKKVGEKKLRSEECKGIDDKLNGAIDLFIGEVKSD
ncbi:uncharacterized protein LOC126842542 [Adelges cooleyi]|uniref:uncharacterized protein LOC126842542 n=1 Tax=Adelges cooleyi TaxID=133065 RepID=UPI0021802287|nr:uncharacterized protein LOC126842542 [Adelges cooleyi]